jgi:hypothetical protein
MKTLYLSLLILTLLLALPGEGRAAPPDPAMASANYTLAWSTVGESHGGAAASNNFGIQSAVVGQMIAQSEGSSSMYNLCTGYACRFSVTYRIFLPLVLRGK